MVKTIDVLGVPHAYELTSPRNSSPVLVFVHGWLLSREYWQPVIQQLAQDYQCLSYDLRGFGGSQISRAASSTRQQELATTGAPRSLSETPSNREMTVISSAQYTPAAYAQDLVALLHHLKISNAWLIGHSLGGSIALWAADQAPHCVQGVTCVNAGGGIYLKEEFERFRAAGQQLVKLRPRWLCYLPLVDVLMTRLNVARPLARQWGRQRLLDMVMAQPEAALGTLLDSTTEAEVHHLPQVVSRLAQPVHFIAGANDTVMEPQYVRHLASFHPLFQCSANNVIELPNCGHMAMVEQPDALIQAIYQILATHPSGVA